MKLGEALLLRADRKRTLEQLRARIQASARYQEGEKPAEDANALISMAATVLDNYEMLIRQINRTNSQTLMDDGRTITDALAERDVLRLRHLVVSSSADAASGAAGQRAPMLRSTRSELKYVTALNVRTLREQASDLARRIRELDGRIQQVNWVTDLQEG